MAAGGEGFGKLGVRIASAVVFGAIVLAIVLFAGPLGLGALLALAAGLAAAELVRLLPGSSRQTVVLASLSAAALPLAAGAGGWTLGSLGAVVLAVATAAAALIAILFWLAVSPSSSAEGAGSAALATVWVGFGLAHLVFLRGVESGGPGLALLAVLGVWAGDVLAYVIGVAIGRHKLAPRLSPNKSWEGFVAGAAATVGVWVGLGIYLALPASPALLVAIGLLTAAAGLLGDLAESRVKRLAGVKDSGSLIPGHGGVLDRFDSLILVSVVAFWTSSIGGLL